MAITLKAVGIAVKDLKGTADFYSKTLGMLLGPTEDFPGDKTRVTRIPLGEARIDLMMGTAPDSPINRFIERRGEGLYFITIEVDSQESYLKELQAKGVRLAGNFVHPSASKGVLIEVLQKR